jgi:3-oxoacyl-[acyl-carrier protein] reductase
MRIAITGASQGIGAATAARLAGPGVELLLHYHRHRAEAEALAGRLAAAGAAAWCFGADLASPSEVDRLAAALADRWTELDALVLNAGDYPRVPVREMTDEQFDQCLATNLTGPARLTRRLLPLLSRAPAARIVFVSSVLAFTGSTHGAHYAAAKAGLLGFARSLARELAPKIRVNVVAPGPIDTAILASDSPERRRQRGAELPLGRVGTADEVAGTIAFLLGPDASFLTGTTIHVNGGAHLG